jgi:hypothetical protein
MDMNLPAAENPPSSRFLVGLAAGAGIVLLLIAGFVLLSRGPGGAKGGGEAPAQLPFGAAEQAYAAQIRFSALQLSQATNMLHQQFTYVVGSASNAGTRSVRGIEVTVEFHDLIQQLVLRDTVRVFPQAAGPLAPGQERAFQLTFEGVPSSWNQQAPSIRVSGLDLQ